MCAQALPAFKSIDLDRALNRARAPVEVLHSQFPFGELLITYLAYEPHSLSPTPKGVGSKLFGSLA